MSKAKTHEEFVQEVVDKFPWIKVLGFYKNNYTKIEIEDTRCGHTWKARPLDLLHGHGCIECYKHSRKKTHEKFVQEVTDKFPWIKVLGIYINNKTKIEVEDTRCNHRWEVRPFSLLKGTGCPVCGREKSDLNLINNTPLSLVEVILRVDFISNHTIEYVDGYINTKLKCWWKCKICNEVWEATPNHILSGKGCPRCAKKSLELPIKNLLDRKHVKYIHDKGLVGCYFKNSNYPLRPDFLIGNDNRKLIIETDGQQHFIPVYGEDALILQQTKDAIKNRYCKENGICLIRITPSPTKEWGTERHLTLDEGLRVLEKYISDDGIVNYDALFEYDFNKI